MSDDRSRLPVRAESAAPVATRAPRSCLVVPAMVADAGHRAAKRFVAAAIEHENIRLTYHRAVWSFFAPLDEHGIGAVVARAVEDYFANGKRWWLRLHKKSSKRREMPAHHELGTS